MNTLKKKHLLRMLAMVDDLVSNDFTADMEGKQMEYERRKRLGVSCGSVWSDHESDEMSSLIGKIYAIAHCIHCEACAKNVLLDIDSIKTV